MALDALTVGAPGQDSSWSGALPSSDAGANADVLAFLQAMVGAAESADAGPQATSTPSPDGMGAAVVTTGGAPECTTVPAWDAVLAQARLHSEKLSQLMREMRALSAETDPGLDGGSDDLLPPVPGIVTLAIHPVVAQGEGDIASPTLAPVEVDEDDHLDEDAAAAAAFLIAVATTTPMVAAPDVDDPVDLPSVTNADGAGQTADAPPLRTGAIVSASDELAAAAALQVAGATIPALPPDATHPESVPNSEVTPAAMRFAPLNETPSADDTDVSAVASAVAPAAADLVSVDQLTPPSTADISANALSAVASQANDDVDIAAVIDAAVATAAAAPSEKSIDSRRPVADESTAAPPANDQPRQPTPAQAVSPRAQAFMRALQQVSAQIVTRSDVAAVAAGTDTPSLPKVAAAIAEQMAEQMAVESAAADHSQSVSTAPATDVVPRRTSTPDADLFALRAQMTTAVAVQRLMDDTRSSTTSGGQHHQRDPQTLLYRESRHVTLSPGPLTSATVLFASSQAAVSEVADVEPPASSGPSLPNEAAVAASLVRSMQWQYRNGVGTAVVHLDPGYLGEVKIALQVQGGSVSATLHAASAEVRAWMQANESTLRQSLASQGLSLETLVVAEEETPSRHSAPDGRRQDDEAQERPRPRRTRRSTEGLTFEVVV